MRNLRLPLSTALAVFGLSVAFVPSASVGAPPIPDTPAGANIFVHLSKQMIPTVVNISTLANQSARRSGRGGREGGGSQEELFRRFFQDFFNSPNGRGGPTMPMPDGGGFPDAPKGPVPLALGTGFIIDSSGLILTNNHVVAGADEIKIHFTEEADEEPTDGKVVGRDPELDLALIKVNTKRALVAAKLGDSDALEVGEYVMAVGNPFGQGHSVTHGIISAKGRKSPDFVLANYLQTDAPINPGNSGGPLVNLKGEVIGINNAIDQRAQGIGFAIPINVVKQVLPQLKTKGTVARGYIGIQTTDLTPEIAQRVGVPEKLRAAFVAHVYPGGPSEKAGVKAYDVITEINGKKIGSSSDLIAAVTAIPAGETAHLKLLRGEKTEEVKVKLGVRPSEAPLAEADPGESKKKPSGKDMSNQGEASGMTVGDLSGEVLKELGLPAKTTGVVVSELRYQGPADKAGLMRGDVIVEVDRKSVKSAPQFYTLIKEKKSYLLRVLRSRGPGQEAFQVVVLDLK